MSDLFGLVRDRLFDEPSDEGTVNPWSDAVEGLDREEAPALRRRNLERYLEAVDDAPRLLLVGEAPGWRGCRFSGIPFTSEAQLEDPDFPVGGARTSAEDDPYREISATIVWGALGDVFPAFLLWNAVPFHPHPPGDGLANRTPRTSEIRRFLPLLADFVEAAGAERVLAVGRTAEKALGEVDVECHYVRHPAQGGATLFRKALAGLLS